MTTEFNFDYRLPDFREYRCGDCEVHLWYLGDSTAEGYRREYYAARLVKNGRILVQLSRWSPAPATTADELPGETVSILTSQAEYASRPFQRTLYFAQTPWSIEGLEQSAFNEWLSPEGWNDWDYDEAIRRLFEFPEEGRWFMADLSDWLNMVLEDDDTHPDADRETYYRVVAA